MPKSNQVDSICNKSQFLFVDFDKNTHNLTNVKVDRDCENCMIMQFDKVNNSIGLSMIMFTLTVDQVNFPDAKGNNIEILNEIQIRLNNFIYFIS